MRVTRETGSRLSLRSSRATLAKIIAICGSDMREELGTSVCRSMSMRLLEGITLR